MHSGKLVNLTIRVDRGVLTLAKHRALLEGTSINRQLADALEDYADGMVDAARRTMSAAHVFGVIEESRRLRRQSKKYRRAGSRGLAPPPDALFPSRRAEDL
jgi:hypothetical protein